jgi:hypothetical protein
MGMKETHPPPKEQNKPADKGRKENQTVNIF